MSCYRCDGAVVVAPRWLGYAGMAKGILEDLGLDPDEHPEIVSELDQDLGEAIIDTVLKALADHGVSRKDLDPPARNDGSPAGEQP